MDFIVKKMVTQIVIITALGFLAFLAILFFSGQGLGILSGSYWKTSTQTAAIQTFSSEFTCPEDRISVEKLEEQNMAERMGIEGPPDDIKKDRERLALWKEKNASGNEFWGAHELYRVKGCDQSKEYGCWCPDLKKGGRFQTSGKSSTKGMQNFCRCTELTRR